MLYDPIADLLTRIRNAGEAKHRYIDIRFSKIKKEIAEALKKRHFIDHYIVDDKHTKLRIYLKFAMQRPTITGLKRVSKPGARIYVAVDKIPIIQKGLGTVIVSTSKGIMDGETARKEKVGGELICKVW